MYKETVNVYKNAVNPPSLRAVPKNFLFHFICTRLQVLLVNAPSSFAVLWIFPLFSPTFICTHLQVLLVNAPYTFTGIGTHFFVLVHIYRYWYTFIGKHLQVLVVNAPSFFAVLWKVIKPFIPPRTADKVFFLVFVSCCV